MRSFRHPRADVCPATERIGGEFHHAEVEATGQAFGNDVIRAVDEEQVALVRGQGSGPRTFDVRQMAVGRLDDVTLSAIGCPHFEHLTCTVNEPPARR